MLDGPDKRKAPYLGPSHSSPRIQEIIGVVTRAAIAHHGFEAVHPFVDANGRVGRLLLNLMLMREGYPPALLLKDWRIRYIHALNEGNTGQYAPLVNLIGQAVEACLDLYLEACAT